MKLNYTTVDLETSGLDPKKYEILEIGILEYNIETFKPTGVEFNIRIKATKPCDPRALEINGLDPTVGVSLDEARAALLNFLQNGKMHGTFHNKLFDVPFMIEHFGHSLMSQLFHYHYGCTQDLASKFIGGSSSLQKLKTKLGLSATEAHTALGDCFTTLELLEYLTKYITFLKNLEKDYFRVE